MTSGFEKKSPNVYKFLPKNHQGSFQYFAPKVAKNLDIIGQNIVATCSKKLPNRR